MEVNPGLLLQAFSAVPFARGEKDAKWSGAVLCVDVKRGGSWRGSKGGPPVQEEGEAALLLSAAAAPYQLPAGSVGGGWSRRRTPKCA